MTKRKSFDELVTGLIPQVRARKQVAEKLASGVWGDEDVLEAAQAQACELRFGTAGAPDPKADADDAEYRAGQEELYRSQFGFDGSSVADEASLQQLLALQTAHRRLELDLKRSRMPYRERNELMHEMRQLTSDHSALQKTLGIDRGTRDARRRTVDPIEEHKKQVADGAAFMQSLIDSAPQAFAAAMSEGELRTLAKHHGGAPYGIVDSLLENHRRVLKLPEKLELGVWA